MAIWKKIVLSLVAIPILVIGGAYIRNKAVGPEGWAMDDTEKQLRAQMKDPDSMVIRSSRTVTTLDPDGITKNIYICGFVDGKNSYGAYGGASRFVSWSTSGNGVFNLVSVTVEEADDKVWAEESGQPSAFEKVYWARHCEPANEARSS